MGSPKSMWLSVLGVLNLPHAPGQFMASICWRRQLYLLAATAIVVGRGVARRPPTPRQRPALWRRFAAWGLTSSPSSHDRGRQLRRRRPEGNGNVLAPRRRCSLTPPAQARSLAGQPQASQRPKTMGASPSLASARTAWRPLAVSRRGGRPEGAPRCNASSASVGMSRFCFESRIGFPS